MQQKELTFYTKLAETLLNTDYDVFAVRADNRDWKEGDEIPNSKEWDLSNDCPSNEDVDGVYGTFIGNKYNTVEDLANNIIEGIKYNKKYGTQQYLIGGSWGYEFGEDAEVIIKYAEVITKL